MADRQKGAHLASSVLLKEVVLLASKRLDALCERSRREQIAKLLHKRRRKWRKKHKLARQVSPMLDVELQDKVSGLEETSFQLKCELVTRRECGTSDAVKLQNQESVHSLEVFRYRLGNENKAIEPYESRTEFSTPHHRNLQKHSPSPGADHIVKDLEATISQAKAVAEIRKMKHAMTPRVPQLHNRTLSGNIFDQSLGILHDSGVTPDSEHAHLEIIGKEVSIWQDDSENNDQQFGGERQQPMSGDGGVGGREAGTVEEAAGELTVAVTSPEKFADDTPGIGMEVVCEEGVDTSDSMNEIESSVLPLHNGVINGLKGTPTDFALVNLHQRAGASGDKSAAEDSDGEVHLKIMRLFQDARYDLRFPVQRYSNQASRGMNSKTPPASSETPEEHISPEPTPAKKRGRPKKSQTPSQNKKRGRPRKNSALTL